MFSLEAFSLARLLSLGATLLAMFVMKGLRSGTIAETIIGLIPAIVRSIFTSSDANASFSCSSIIFPTLSFSIVVRIQYSRSKSSTFSVKYFFKNSGLKKAVMIVFFTAARISLNRLGITPEPYSRGIRSNSIFTANQFVTPPEKPNSPNVRTNLAATLSSPLAILQSRPMRNITNEITLEMKPFSHQTAVQAGSSKSKPLAISLP
mmetsp:Transcript_11205/g.27552  ORF Transcript_11205/g.27552 Transcript_11205/m.27552 type:complete len:206 (+) Transcript_11205:486-1103(+)